MGKKGHARTDGLTTRQIEAVRLVAAGQSNIDIAATIGVHPDSVSRWKAEPAFKAALSVEQEARAQEARVVLTGLRDQALATGMAALSKAMQILQDLGDDATISDAVLVSREAREWVKTSAPHTGLVERREVELTPSEQLEQVLARAVEGKTPEELDDAIARLKAAS